MAKRKKTTMLSKLGKEMRQLGYSGSLLDYPTVKDRRDWIRGAAPYRYDLNNPKKNPSTEAMSGLFIAVLIGFAIAKRR